jgi:hypothetical protein
MKPTFTHDCERCKFLGHILTVNGNADVYRNLIFRYSDEPADYSHIGAERTAYLFKF